MIKGEVGKAKTIWGAIVKSQFCYLDQSIELSFDLSFVFSIDPFINLSI